MKLKDITVQIGGFHDHWRRNMSDNATLLAAAMQYYHYDFICLMDGFDAVAEREKAQVEQWLPGAKVHLGEERTYGWGHVVTVGNHFATDDPENTDYTAEFDRMRAAGGLVALAHIGYPTTVKTILPIPGELDRLIDERHVDAIQFESAANAKYVQERIEKGERLPLIGGWDSHLLLPKPNMPDVLYSAACTPDGHIDSAPGMRTVVFAESNNFEAICEAVRAGRTVLEQVSTGELIGNPKYVQMLLERDYLGEMHRLDAALDAQKLQCPETLCAHRSGELRFPGKGTVTFPKDGNLTPQTAETDENGILHLSDIPMPVMQDESHLPFAWSDGKQSRIWAVRVRNNIRIRTVPMLSRGKRVLNFRADADFDGELRLTQPITEVLRVTLKQGECLELPVPETVPLIFRFEFDAVAREGGTRHYADRAMLALAPKFDGDWRKSPAYAVDSAEFAGGYGCNRPYPGKEVFSAEVRFAWDDRAFYLYTDIRDPEYVHPPAGAFMYNGDCVQLALDPLLKRAVSRAECTEFNLGVPESGPQIWRVRAAADIPNSPQMSKPAAMPGKLTMTPKEGGRTVTAEIPWSVIDVRLAPEAGTHMGFFLLFENDNGSGLIDAMQWPWLFAGMWMVPARWGVLCLTE